jgi:hypothetical protein
MFVQFKIYCIEESHTTDLGASPVMGIQERTEGPYKPPFHHFV